MFSSRNLVLFVCFLMLSAGVRSQDLGSSNKLFRSPGKKSKSSSAPAKKAAPKKTIPVAAKSKTPAKAKTNLTANASTTAQKTTKSVSKPAVKAPANNSSVKSAPTAAANNRPPVAIIQPVKLSPQNNQSKNTLVKAEQPVNSEYDELFEQQIEEGNAARDERNYMKAEGAYLRAQSLKTKDSRAIYGLGNLYADQQRWEEAERSYRTAIELEPGAAEARIALSYVLTQPITGTNLSDRYSEAEQVARRAIELDPKNSLAYDQLGVSLELSGKIGNETIRAYRRAIELDPEFALAYAHLGRLLRRKGESNESSEAYRKAIQLSTDVPTMILVAEVMQSQQRFFDSEQLLRRALQKDPKHPTALFLLGRALTTRGSFDEAESVLKKSADISPNGFVAYMLLGSMYMRQSKFSKAEDSLMKALKVVSMNEKKRLAQEFELIGDGYLQNRKKKDAARVYRLAMNLDREKNALPAKLAKALED